MTIKRILRILRRKAIVWHYRRQEKQDLQIVTKDYFSIRNLVNTTKNVQLHAVRQQTWVIQYIDNPWPIVQIEALKAGLWYIQYIQDPCREAQIICVRDNTWNIQYIKNPCEEAQIAYASNCYMITDIDNSKFCVEARVALAIRYPEQIHNLGYFDEETIIKIIKGNNNSSHFFKDLSKATQWIVLETNHTATISNIDSDVSDVKKFIQLFKQYHDYMEANADLTDKLLKDVEEHYFNLMEDCKKLDILKTYLYKSIGQSDQLTPEVKLDFIMRKLS